jgi:hypothetical protein
MYECGQRPNCSTIDENNTTTITTTTKNSKLKFNDVVRWS